MLLTLFCGEILLKSRRLKLGVTLLKTNTDRKISTLMLGKEETKVGSMQIIA
jgi:hypothetical protein